MDALRVGDLQLEVVDGHRDRLRALLLVAEHQLDLAPVDLSRVAVHGLREALAVGPGDDLRTDRLQAEVVRLAPALDRLVPALGEEGGLAPAVEAGELELAVRREHPELVSDVLARAHRNPRVHAVANALRRALGHLLGGLRVVVKHISVALDRRAVAAHRLALLGADDDLLGLLAPALLAVLALGVPELLGPTLAREAVRVDGHARDRGRSEERRGDRHEHKGRDPGYARSRSHPGSVQGSHWGGGRWDLTPNGRLRAPRAQVPTSASSAATRRMNSSRSPSRASSASHRRRSRARSSCACGSSAGPKWVRQSRDGSHSATASSERSHASTSMSGGGVGGIVKSMG